MDKKHRMVLVVEDTLEVRRPLVKFLEMHGFSVTVAETDHADLWQRATLTAALTGGSLATLAAAADNVERWLHSRCPDGVRVQRVVASVEELL